MAGAPIRVVVEVGRKRTFASALDWPGWSRSGRTEADALDALAAYRDRYAIVVGAAGLRGLPARPTFEVVETLAGDATTDFGAPGAVAAADSEPVDAATARRLAALLEAAWAAFDAQVAISPASLRKGPRGGGRDRDAMVEHVDDAEAAYARKLGVATPTKGGPTIPEAVRAAILECILPGDGAPSTPKGWPLRYGVRRATWHVLDHLWEMQDRID